MALPVSFERAPTVQVGELSVAEESRRTAADCPALPQLEDAPEPTRRWPLVALFIVGVLISSGLAGVVAVYLIGGW